MTPWNTRLLVRGAAVLSVVLATGFAALTAAAAKQPVAGKVTFLKGKAARATSSDGPWEKLKRNNPIYVGDYVKTESDARLELRYQDKSIVRIAADSTMRIEEASVDMKQQKRAVTASLIAGKAWASISSVVEVENRFEIKTENAVAGVRGTTFRINAEEDKSTLIKVYAGAVAVSNAPFFQKPKEPEEAKPKIDFKNRKPIDAPMQEVSKKEWEQLVGQWMQVRVAADGTMDQATKFAQADEAADEWVAWNNERDLAKAKP